MVTSRDFDDRCHFLGRGWQDDDIWRTAVDRGIILVEHQVVWRAEHVARSYDISQFAHYLCLLCRRHAFIQGHRQGGGSSVMLMVVILQDSLLLPQPQGQRSSYRDNTIWKSN